MRKLLCWLRHYVPARRDIIPCSKRRMVTDRFRERRLEVEKAFSTLREIRDSQLACYGAVAENAHLPITLKRPVRGGSGATGPPRRRAAYSTGGGGSRGTGLRLVLNRDALGMGPVSHGSGNGYVSVNGLF